MEHAWLLFALYWFSEFQELILLKQLQFCPRRPICIAIVQAIVPITCSHGMYISVEMTQKPHAKRGVTRETKAGRGECGVRERERHNTRAQIHILEYTFPCGDVSFTSHEA
jgi:hypothetical protein